MIRCIMNISQLTPRSRSQLPIDDNCFVSIGDVASMIVAQLRQKIEADQQKVAAE